MTMRSQPTTLITIYTYIHIPIICKIITMSSRVLDTHTSGAGYNNNNNIKDDDYFCYSEFTLYCNHQTDAIWWLLLCLYINRLAGTWYVSTNHQGVFTPRTLGTLEA